MGGCDNHSRYPEKVVKRSHVTELTFHCFPKDEAKRQLKNNKVVSSNHFEFGNPNVSAIPLAYMTMQKAEQHLQGKEEK